MISFIRGFVVSVGQDYALIENNGIGYHLMMSKTAHLSLDDEITIHTYLHVREAEISLFGFESVKAREIFLQLISVKGIGPKTANNILSKANVSDLVLAIKNSDVNFLKSLPGIGAKSAQQIILDLQNKLSVEEKAVVNSELSDAIEGLLALGYSSRELGSIEKQLSKKVMSASEYLKAGLALLNKRKRG